MTEAYTDHLEGQEHMVATNEREDVAPHVPLPDPVRVADVEVHPVTAAQAVDLVAALARSPEPALVVTPNVDHVVLLREDVQFAAAYRSARLRLCDGMPLVALSRLCGQPLPGRVTGADLFLHVCARAAADGLRVFVAGGMPDVLADGIAEMRRRFPDLTISGHSPPLDFEGTAEDDDLRRRIASARPHVVMVCLGAPRAEVWASEQQHRFPAVYLCVGAAIDFAAGARRRAPRWVQRSGLEWLYRLGQEPGRLWRRYLVRDARFLPIAARSLASCSAARLRGHLAAR